MLGGPLFAFKRIMHTMLLGLPLVVMHIPHAHSILSLASLYIFAQAFGLLYMFLVPCWAAISTRVITRVTAGALLMPPTLSFAPSVVQLFESGFRSGIVVYVYVAFLHTTVIFTRRMWTVAWELYHDFPTVRKMLAPKMKRISSSPAVVDRHAALGGAHETMNRKRRVVVTDANDRDSDGFLRTVSDASETADDVSHSEVEKLTFAKRLEAMRASPEPRKSSRRGVRRRVVLYVPLAFLVALNIVMVAAPQLCDLRDAGCKDFFFGIFHSRSRLNRAVRFALFLSLAQWAQAWVAFFPKWNEALAHSSSPVAHLLSVLLIFTLAPLSCVRFSSWLVRPGGSDMEGYGPYKLVGISHAAVDRQLVCWASVWLLTASIVILRSADQDRSGWSIRRFTEDRSWIRMCVGFKFTMFAWLGLHMIRGLLTMGSASAQNDLLIITIFYPLLLTAVWILTYIGVFFTACNASATMLTKAAVGLIVIGVVSWVACGYVGLSAHPLLVLATWIHLSRQAFCFARGGIDSTPKFAVHPSNSAEKTLARWVITTLCVIAGIFFIALGSSLLAGRLQKSSGLVMDDVVSWTATESSVVVNNARVSVLTLMNGTEHSIGNVNQPHYGSCGHHWHGFSMTDYAMFSLVSYMNPSTSDVPALLRRLMPHKDIVVKKTPSRTRKWLECEVTDCQDTCNKVTVIAISGTDPTMIFDYAENLRMWTEPVLLQILGAVFPTVRLWPRDTTAMVIAEIHELLRKLAIPDDEWHYSEILNHVREIPAERNVILTGHSLGGGMALVVGALTDRLCVAIHPPGVYHSLAKHVRGDTSESRVHRNSVSIITEGDWIQHFDSHGGLVQNIVCDHSQNVQLGCHMLEGAICHLLRHCGDPAGRFSSCKHEYRPISFMEWIGENVIQNVRSRSFALPELRDWKLGFSCALAVVLPSQLVRLSL